MNADIKKYHLISVVLVFIVLPVLFLNLGDFPRRSFLKESISMMTVLAFSLMLGQFFLSRSNQYFTRAFKFSRVFRVHKLIGYSVVGLFLVHPFLIVLPRFYEAGVSPFDALITMLTTFESLGVVLGLISWSLMLLIGVTSLFRDKLNMRYKKWKLFHGSLSVLFIATASWHAIELGRHTDKIISAFIILLALSGSILLIRQYALTFNKALGAKQ
jgi:predicted ferric reductase